MVTIRPATSADAQNVAKLLAEAFRDDPAWAMSYSDPATRPGKLEAHYRHRVRRHPELADKPVVVYAPTFRRGCEGQIIPQQRQLIEGLAASPDFTLVIREHPNQPLTPHLADLQDSFITCPDLSTLQILSVADLVITDYSAVLIEAASARVPFLLYCFDFETYTQNNGLNLNLRQLFNDLYAEDPQRIFEAVEGFLRGSYPSEEFEAFVSTYTLPDPGHATRDLAALAIGNTSLKGACDPCAM